MDVQGVMDEQIKMESVEVRKKKKKADCTHSFSLKCVGREGSR